MNQCTRLASVHLVILRYCITKCGSLPGVTRLCYNKGGEIPSEYYIFPVLKGDPWPTHFIHFKQSMLSGDSHMGGRIRGGNIASEFKPDLYFHSRLTKVSTTFLFTPTSGFLVWLTVVQWIYLYNFKANQAPLNIFFILYFFVALVVKIVFVMCLFTYSTENLTLHHQEQNSSKNHSARPLKANSSYNF